jgi:hypothetical protein
MLQIVAKQIIQVVQALWEKNICTSTLLEKTSANFLWNEPSKIYPGSALEIAK